MVYYLNEDGALEECKTKVFVEDPNNRYVIFETNHFSVYVLAEVANKVEEKIEEKTEEKTEDKEDKEDKTEEPVIDSGNADDTLKEDSSFENNDQPKEDSSKEINEESVEEIKTKEELIDETISVDDKQNLKTYSSMGFYILIAILLFIAFVGIVCFMRKKK